MGGGRGDSPGGIHHREAAEVAARERHGDAADQVDVVVTDEHRETPLVREEVTEEEEGDEEDAQHDGKPHPARARLSTGEERRQGRETSKR